MIPYGTSDNVAADYRTVRTELEAYGAGLSEKIELVGLNKVQGKPFTVSEIAFAIRELVA